MQTLKILSWVIITVLVIDILGFVAWSMSEQHPVDGFYAGAITTNVLRIIIN